MKVCTKCHIEKEESEFAKVKAYKNGIKSSCKVCDNLLTKKWRKENVEYVKINNRERKKQVKYKEWLKNYLKTYKRDNKTVTTWNKKYRGSLGNGYIKKLLRDKNLPQTPEVVELHRIVLKIKREIWKKSQSKKQQQTP